MPRKAFREYKVYNGIKYYKNAGGYYWSHRKGIAVALHRKIYVDNFGRIPEGCHIHHKDGDKENNSPDNLECLSPHRHNTVHKKGVPMGPMPEERKNKIRKSWRERVERLADSPYPIPEPML